MFVRLHYWNTMPVAGDSYASETIANTEHIAFVNKVNCSGIPLAKIIMANGAEFYCPWEEVYQIVPKHIDFGQARCVPGS